MKNYVQPGNTITLTAPYAVASGDGLLVGSIFGIAAGAAAALGGVFFDGTALPMVIAIALCSLISLTLAVLTLGRPRQPSQAPGQ